LCQWSANIKKKCRQDWTDHFWSNFTILYAFTIQVTTPGETFSVQGILVYSSLFSLFKDALLLVI